MALQHVLDTARRLGIPVVITNEAGEESQVVMPFDDFAAMVGATSPAPRTMTGAALRNRPRVSHMEERSSMAPIQDEIAEALAELHMEEMSMEVPMPSMERTETKKGGVSAPKEEGFPEDKFYLEPLDDENPTS